MSKAVWGAALRLGAVVGLGFATASCGTVARQGTASSFLVIKALEAASGAEPGVFGGTLSSDVVTVVKSSPTIFNDLGRAQFTLALKDPGSPESPAGPSQANWITVEWYHVRYIRSDGRNTEGKDVPYSFDNGVTATVTSEDTTVGFMLVRNQAKMEAPLSALAANGLVVSVIAEVTFYGHDQTGRTVSVVGNIGISFANFGDPS
jgi:hypothetical protein